MVNAFEIALKQRKVVQVEFTRVHNNYILKNAELEKAAKNPRQPEVTKQLQLERVELEKRIDLERKLFEEVTQRLLKDAEKNKPKLLEMLRESFLSFTEIQISYQRQFENAFTNFIPKLNEQPNGKISADGENKDVLDSDPAPAMPPASTLPPSPP